MPKTRTRFSLIKGINIKRCSKTKNFNLVNFNFCFENIFFLPQLSAGDWNEFLSCLRSSFTLFFWNLSVQLNSLKFTIGNCSEMFG